MRDLLIIIVEFELFEVCPDKLDDVHSFRRRLQAWARCNPFFLTLVEKVGGAATIGFAAPAERRGPGRLGRREGGEKLEEDDDLRV